MTGTGSSFGAVVWPTILANLPQRSELVHDPWSPSDRDVSRFRMDLSTDGADRLHLLHFIIHSAQNSPATETTGSVLLHGGIQEFTVQLGIGQLRGTLPSFPSGRF